MNIKNKSLTNTSQSNLAFTIDYLDKVLGISNVVYDGLFENKFASLPLIYFYYENYELLSSDQLELFNKMLYSLKVKAEFIKKMNPNNFENINPKSIILLFNDNLENNYLFEFILKVNKLNNAFSAENIFEVPGPKLILESNLTDQKSLKQRAWQQFQTISKRWSKV